MAQLDDLQAYVNLEMPRRMVLLTVAITGYDGDPNDGGAPAIIQSAPLGTQYYEETGDNWWRKRGATWELIEGGGGMAEQLQTLLDEDGAYTYVGYSVPGTLTSAASWLIFRLDETGSAVTNTELVKRYAGGSTDFDQIWDNRTGLVYS